MEDSRNIIKAIDALTQKVGGEVIDSKNITEAIDHLKEVYSQEAIEIDDTLTQEGLAADAKAVGDAISTLDTKTLKCRVVISDSNKNLVKVVENQGNYLMSWTYPEDGSAYYVAIVHKQDGNNPIITPIASNKLSSGEKNSVGTIVPMYNDKSASGIVCNVYFLG